jgi:hypothetical protein
VESSKVDGGRGFSNSFKGICGCGMPKSCDFSSELVYEREDEQGEVETVDLDTKHREVSFKGAVFLLIIGPYLIEVCSAVLVSFSSDEK